MFEERNDIRRMGDVFLRSAGDAAKGIERPDREFGRELNGKAGGAALVNPDSNRPFSRVFTVFHPMV